MGFYIDLSQITLGEYKRKLTTGYLLPSQQILKESIDTRFRVLHEHHINNMHQLQQTLKTKAKVTAFAAKTSIPINYLIILRREVNSYHPQPRKIRDFPSLREHLKTRLHEIGIKTTKDLFERVATKTERSKLQQELNITDNEALELAKLTDVSRLRYVNQTFATLLVHSKYDTVDKISQADHRELFDHLQHINENKRFFKGRFGLQDMKSFITDTALVRDYASKIEY
jgi:hypothetical protein